MRRLVPALLAAALLAPPALAFAHDPLDDVSGEEDLNAKKDEEKPRSEKKARQEVEFAKELQERDDTSFTLDREKDEFLRDRTETKDVLEAQRRRNQLGTGGRSGGHAPAPKPEPQPDPTEVKAQPNGSPSNRGDVDPTDPGEGNRDDSAAKKGPKKKK